MKAIAFACMLLITIVLSPAAKSDSLPLSAGIEILPIVDSPIRVDAVIIGHVTDGQFDWSEIAFDSTYRITSGQNVQIVSTTLFGALSKDSGIDYQFTGRAGVLAVAQSGVEWQPPYLLVSSDHEWKRSQKNDRTLFKVEGSAARKVAVLYGGQDQTPGEGRFYSRLPPSPLNFFCVPFHFDCAPEWLIALDDNQGTLTVNGQATWLKNEPLWQQNDEFIHGELAEIAADKERNVRDWGESYDSRHGNVFGAIVENAMLAKYCGQDTALAELMTFVRPYLDDPHHRSLEMAVHAVTPLDSFGYWNLR